MSKIQRKRARAEYQAELAHMVLPGAECLRLCPVIARRRKFLMAQARGGPLAAPAPVSDHIGQVLFVVPPMPRLGSEVHREKICSCPIRAPPTEELPDIVCACVYVWAARLVNKAESGRTPAAMAAWRKEWDRLRRTGPWGESHGC